MYEFVSEKGSNNCDFFIQKGTFWVPKRVRMELLGVLGRPGMLLECFGSTLGDFWTLLLDLGSQIGVPKWSPNRLRIDLRIDQKLSEIWKVMFSMTLPPGGSILEPWGHLWCISGAFCYSKAPQKGPWEVSKRYFFLSKVIFQFEGKHTTFFK